MTDEQKGNSWKLVVLDLLISFMLMGVLLMPLWQWGNRQFGASAEWNGAIVGVLMIVGSIHFILNKIHEQVKKIDNHGN